MNKQKSLFLIIVTRTVFPVTKEKVNFLSLELNALCQMLDKMVNSLALEQKLEALTACQKVSPPF